MLCLDLTANVRLLDIYYIAYIQGNPVERENHYQAFVVEATSVVMLDNVAVRKPAQGRVRQQ